MQAIINLIILIFSAIVHEVSHGLVAEKLGDETARRHGRITLNPLVHIDPFGSIFLPLILLLAGSPVILGSAKPVPVNFNNLRNPRSGMALVSLAGPLSNLVLAILFVLPIKLGLANAISGPILIQAVFINLALAIFNILPIPPLDGSKIVAAFAPKKWMYTLFEWERYGFFIIFILLYLGILDRVFVPLMTGFIKLFNLF
jgi:Zn-dependent protease